MISTGSDMIPAKLLKIDSKIEGYPVCCLLNPGLSQITLLDVTISWCFNDI